jgi:hypothetical protein
MLHGDWVPASFWRFIAAGGANAGFNKPVNQMDTGFDEQFIFGRIAEQAWELRGVAYKPGDLYSVSSQVPGSASWRRI